MRNALLSLFALAVFCLTPAAPAAADSVAQLAPQLFQDADFAYRSLDLDQQRFLYSFVDSPTVEHSRLVRPALQPKDIVGTVRIELFPGEEVTVERTRFEERGENDYTWVGTVPGRLTQAILVVNGEHLTGSVIDGERYYAIRPIGGGLSVVALIDQTAFPADHPEGEYERLEQEARPISHPMTPGSGRYEAVGMKVGQELDVSWFPIPEIVVRVDVIVAYTNTAAAEVADIDGLIQTAVAETNQSFNNTDAPVRIRLVHSYHTNYDDDPTMRTNRNRFRDDGDGYMDEIHGLRDTYGGDAAVLIQGRDPDACGIVTEIGVSPSTAFAVVGRDCATGYYSFGHELGHMFGARHNIQADSKTTPFAYGHGFYYEPDSWRTVMSYNCPTNCTRLPFFSNPDRNYGGVPTGTAADEDNARVLYEARWTLAGFR